MLNPKQNSGTIRIDNKYYFIKIKAKLPVFVAKNVIYQNRPILPNVEKKEVDFKFFYSKPLNYISDNLIASKIISKNAIINKSNTKKIPAVIKNSKVKVIIKSKNILITSSAKALRDGEINDTIQIKMNNKIFNAKIIKKGVVEISD